MTMRHLICAATALVICAATLPAQNCLGGPASAQRHSLGLMFAGSQGAEGDDGGLGLTFGMTTPTNQTARVEFASRAVVPDNSGSSEEDFMYTRFAGTLARPMGTPKQSASGTSTSGLCAMGQVATTIKSSYSDESELGRPPSSPTAAYSAAVGGAWALSTASAGVYAGPLFGISSANGESAMFTTVHVGGGVKLGRFLLNGELNAPMGSEGATNYIEVRAGWMW